MKTKKAQGLSLNVIIIAVLALVVLVVLLVIFTGKTGKFAKSADSCETQGGECKPWSSCIDPNDQAVYSRGSGICKSGICCIKLYDK